MTTKTVHSFHPFTRVYVGPVDLNESDMSPLEPGVWLIPGGCLEAEPPTPAAGQHVVEEGGAWVLRDIPIPPPPPPPPEPVLPPEVGEPPAPTLEGQMRAMDDMLEQMLDDIAVSQGFRNMDRAVSYQGDPRPAVHARARALFQYRADFWAVAGQVQQQILSGEVEVPTPEQARAMLPVFVPLAAEPSPAEPGEPE